MIDPDAILTEYLNTRDRLTGLADKRMYASLNLPKEYLPADGPALLFNPRTGGVQDYTGLVLRHSYQFRSYGLTEAIVRELDRALFDELNDVSYCKIKIARMETAGQLLREPDTRWPFVLSYYTIFFTNS